MWEGFVNEKYNKFSNKDRLLLDELADYYIRSFDEIVALIEETLKDEKGKPFKINKK